MRIVVIDNDMQFTTSLSQRCKKAGVFCQIFQQSAPALAELQKDPDGVDIVLISKEQAGGQDGLAIAQAVRKDPKTADVPYIIMSSVWGKADFAKHQKTDSGANAYYSKKSLMTELDSTIEAVTGFKFPAANAQTQMTQMTVSSSSLNVQLHAANDVVNIAEEVPNDISMEAPINLFPDGEPPTPPKPISKAPPQAAKPQAAATQTATKDSVTETAAPVAEMTQGSMVTMPTMTGQAEKPVVATAPSAAVEISLGGAAPAPAAPAAAATPPPPAAPKAESGSGGIEISLGGNMDFQVESSSKPKTDAPAPSAGPLEISLSGSAAAPAAPAASAPSIVIPAGAEAPAANVEIPPVVGEISSTGAPSAPSITATASAPETPGAAPQINVAQEPVAPPVSEEEAAKDLPYLFAGPSAGLGASVGNQNTTMTRSGIGGGSANAGPAHPQVDVSAGGPLSNDVETLKKYLTMREQDVSVLTAQLTYAKEELGKSENTIKRLTLENEDLFHQINDLKKRVDEQDQELQHAGKSREGEVDQLRFEVKSKIDRIKFVEDRLNDSAQQYEKLKERVRLDIRKIRVREKELESKLEILKKDSETLIAARENKILELKRKIDLLEFNYDTLQDKNDLEKQNVVKANEKIDRVLKVIKLAMGVIEAEGEQHAGAAAESVHEKNIKAA